MGRRRGIGWDVRNSAFNAGFPQGHPSMTSVSKDEEIKILRAQSEAMQRSQKAIEKRLIELEKGND